MRDVARREPQRRPAAGPAAVSAAPAQGVLALQRAVGNRAVGQVLAREPAAGRVDLGDLGAVEITSFSWGTPSNGGVTDIHLSSLVGRHSPALARAAVSGTLIARVVVEMHGGRVVLSDVYISSYQASRGGEQPSEAWTLTFRSAEFGRG